MAQLAILGWLWMLLAAVPSGALETASEHIERGHAVLHQARHEYPGDRREQRLATAVKAFTKAYEIGGRQTKVRALIGAAQGYLSMQKAPAQFPFLWRASPWQRAQKSLQHVLALQPDNSAAHLLMGLALWQRAGAQTAQSNDYRQRSLTHLSRAAELGLPVRLPTARVKPAASFPPLFTPRDVILSLRFVDARATGVPQDVLFVYRHADDEGHCYGVVLSQGTSYPMIAEPATAAMAPSSVLQTLTVTLQAQGRPHIVAVWQHEGRRGETRFVWDGAQFMRLAEHP